MSPNILWNGGQGGGVGGGEVSIVLSFLPIDPLFCKTEE